ncbi:hypothetical protein GNY06_11650 [Elizabethkingia argentiflava]|uniref:SbsA Ig-like domain-containing protein n=1 Tax=Elizabethkingia argenteiflava TaxID=2681556 RepID=A0A845PUU3_9FLAO|nr:Ig-like domain-containing domain [Elizabethkingia argenteiflava]NAW51992.1 hypothetical protein [Elizabethkingia argenteiflava]
MRNLFFLWCMLLMFSCARVGEPEGGKMDKTPPRVLSSKPDSMATNVPTSLKELRINFDEYIILKDAAKQLIISPPIKKIKKTIPSSMANKYILIQWEDTLKANTTYSFNFGNSIADNNEGNILPYYNFVFSTGEKIDSLYVSGYVDDILKPKNKNKELASNENTKPTVVGLYQKGVKDYREKPYYIGQVDADGYFELTYLAAGDYNLIAFQDDNMNNIYDPGKEKIAFLSEPLHLDQNMKGLRLLLSSPKKKFRYVEAKMIPGGVNLIFEGKPDSLQLHTLGNTLSDYKIRHKPKSDSAFIWINPKAEKLTEIAFNFRFSYYNAEKKKIDTTSTYYKVNPKDELVLSNRSGSVLPPESGLRLGANMALDNVDFSQWKLTTDSITSVPFQARVLEGNPFDIQVDASFMAGKKYSLRVPKESVSSFYYKNSKPIIFNFGIGKNEDYGALTFKLKNAPQAPFWFQLLNDNFEVVNQQKVEGKTEIKINHLQPQTYSVRILVDNNRNGVWDGADFETHTQPEEAYLYRKKMAVRPLWNLTEDWDLKDTSPPSTQEEQDENLMPSGSGIRSIEDHMKEKSDEGKSKEVDKKEQQNRWQRGQNQGFTN